MELLLFLDLFMAWMLWDEARPVAIFSLCLPLLFLAYFALFQWWPVIPTLFSWLF